jgi:thioredoxin-related protein
MRFGFMIVFICSVLLLQAQVDTITPPYKRFPTVPPLQLLLGDSTTKFTKDNIPRKKPVLIMLFSPDCNHCQRTAEELWQHQKEMKDIVIVMSTLHSISQMNAFVREYRLDEIKNIVTGKDVHYILPSFYGIKNLPYLAMYDRKGKLIMGFEGSMPVIKILQTFKEK